MSDPVRLAPYRPGKADLLPERALALRWDRSLRTLQRMRIRGEVPPWLAIGRSVYYRYSDIIDYEKNTRQGGGL